MDAIMGKRLVAFLPGPVLLDEFCSTRLLLKNMFLVFTELTFSNPLAYRSSIKIIVLLEVHSTTTKTLIIYCSKSPCPEKNCMP